MLFRANKMNNNKHKAFTLAEVLITLVIIGIIAAMTVPTIIANSRKSEIETRMLQTYSALNNALTKAVAENGPVYTWDITSPDLSENKFIDFFKEYLEPYLNFSNKVEKSTLKKYGYNKPIPTKVDIIDNNKERYLARLNNGTTFLGFKYGWFFKASEDKDAPNVAWASIAYLIDVNGAKGPNQISKDVFMFNLFFVEDNPKFELLGISKPQKIPLSQVNSFWKSKNIPISRNEQYENCKKGDGSYCGALIQNNGWKIPKDYPLRI